MEVIQGGFVKGHWQSDREAYSDEDIEAWNAIFQKMAEKHGPGWKILIWNVKADSKPELRRVK
ncbi:MAG: hypothetical protein C4567_01250 [Deltaproteobacteria bacterium]|nr:MAG: hypothetical protein C4567_01250 [Deltaproteobacteria bacterium]